jgi:hypothetical protein
LAALEYAPNNPTALSGKNLLLDELYTETKSLINNGEYRKAGGYLNILAEHYNNQSEIKQLQSVVDKERAKQNQLARTRAKLEQLNKEARSISRQRQTVSTNDQLREIYLSILELDSDNREAIDGLTSTSGFEAQMIEEAIGAREFDRAQQSLNLIKRTTPDYFRIKELSEKIAVAARAEQQAQELITNAKNLIAKPFSPTSTRGNLIDAWNNIESARKVDPDNPQIKDILLELEKKYVAIILKLRENKNSVLANSFLEDTQNKVWPGEQLMKLQAIAAAPAKKKKKKIIVTGGF